MTPLRPGTTGQPDVWTFNIDVHGIDDDHTVWVGFSSSETPHLAQMFPPAPDDIVRVLNDDDGSGLARVIEVEGEGVRVQLDASTWRIADEPMSGTFFLFASHASQVVAVPNLTHRPVELVGT